ncbi:MAG: hypothetical protein BWY74_01322 [Firmicutes bacterium ADurb.Bin419]|nr:MAG: hypothetical protein BWY74_01322 [Firmicutes bacterium ADurb.Bin419]
MMKKFLISLFFTILMLLFSLEIYYVYANVDKVQVIYFYSTTCSTCQKIEGYFKELSEENANVEFIKYNIMKLENKSLMELYNKSYNVQEKDLGIVPVVFVKDTYFVGEKAIRNNLERIIKRNDNSKTRVIEQNNNNNFNSDIMRFSKLKLLGIVLSGLINGINPCSISMLLFFLSIVSFKRDKVLKFGFMFCVGKFLTFLLLGTFLYSFLSKLNISWYYSFSKIFLLFIVIILVILNLQDFFRAKNEQYNRIKVQLPKILRKANHNLIKRAGNISNDKLLIFVSFSLGVIISLGDFLCTGQIYLATIITILHSVNELTVRAFIYLVIYGIAFIIPLLILNYLIYKGKEVFEMSDLIRQKLHVIKFFNALCFAIFGLIIVFLF